MDFCFVLSFFSSFFSNGYLILNKMVSFFLFLWTVRFDLFPHISFLSLGKVLELIFSLYSVNGYVLHKSLRYKLIMLTPLLLDEMDETASGLKSVFHHIFRFMHISVNQMKKKSKAGISLRSLKPSRFSLSLLRRPLI